MKKVLIDLHDEPVGGNFSKDTTAHKILRAGYYWPTLFKDAHAHVRVPIIITFFQVFLVFGVAGSVKSMLSGYSLDMEFNSASNELS